MPKIQYEKILPSAHNLYIHNFVVSLLYIYFLRKSMLFFVTFVIKLFTKSTRYDSL